MKNNFKWKLNDLVSYRVNTINKHFSNKNIIIPKLNTVPKNRKVIKAKNKLIQLDNNLKKDFDLKNNLIRNKNRKSNQNKLNFRNLVIAKKIVSQYTQHFKNKKRKKTLTKKRNLKEIYIIFSKVINILKVISEFDIDIYFYFKNKEIIFPEIPFFLDKTELFFKAIIKSDLNKIKELINNNINLKFQINYNKMNCIHVAVKNGNLDVLIYLLSLKCPINRLDIYKRTPLFYSYYKLDLKIQKILLIFKWNPFIIGNYKDKYKIITNNFFLENIENFKKFWLENNIYNNLKYKNYNIFLPEEYFNLGKEVKKIYKKVTGENMKLIKY